MKVPDLDFSTAKEGLNTIFSYINFFNKSYGDFVKDGALTDITTITNVEPLTIVSKDLISLDYTKDVSQTMLTLFSAYYLQAVAILSSITDVNVRNTLDKLNPNRSSTILALESHPSTSLENYKYELPTTTSIALEMDKDAKKQILEASNLSVGKLLDVTIKIDGNRSDGKVNTVTIPIAIRLSTTIATNDTIINLLTGGSEDKGLVERFHAWRSGRISFIRDLIFCQDLINENKKNNIKDKSNLTNTIANRVLKSKGYGVLSKNPSLAVASNLFIISETVAKGVEYKLGQPLSNSKARTKLFENTHAMIIAVVDREWERATFYTRGVSEPTDLSIKELKSSKSGGDADITDILKSFQLGMGANF